VVGLWRIEVRAPLMEVLQAFDLKSTGEASGTLRESLRSEGMAPNKP
jgi:hypothetical protein